MDLQGDEIMNLTPLTLPESHGFILHFPSPQHSKGDHTYLRSIHLILVMTDGLVGLFQLASRLSQGEGDAVETVSAE